MENEILDFYKKVSNDYKVLQSMRDSSHYNIKLGYSKYCNKIEAEVILKTMWITLRQVLFIMGYTRDKLDEMSLEVQDKFYYLETAGKLTNLKEMYAFLTEKDLDEFSKNGFVNYDIRKILPRI